MQTKECPDQTLKLPLKHINGVCIVDANGDRLCTLNQSRADRHSVGEQLASAPSQRLELIDAIGEALINLDNNAPQDATNRLHAALKAALREHPTKEGE